MWRISDSTRFRSSSKLHRMLQLIVAEWLSAKGYEVYIEEPFDDGLVADLYAESPWASLIVEVETGFIDPRGLEAAEYYLAGKTLIKALKYSRHADAFAIAHPSYLRLEPTLIRGGDSLSEDSRIALDAISKVMGRPVEPVTIDALLEVVISGRSVRVIPLTGKASLLF